MLKQPPTVIIDKNLIVMFLSTNITAQVQPMDQALHYQILVNTMMYVGRWVGQSQRTCLGGCANTTICVRVSVWANSTVRV